ncbi:MAG: aminopeptidase P family protein [Acidobacteria bacterium]|nr:aminopeptidase P family protein [Acidobacteriota bacterium]
MKNINYSRMRNLTLIGTLVLSASGGVAAPRRSALASEPPAIRESPPAPVFRDEERLAELAARRARVAEQIGPKSILVMFSGEPRVYTNDVSYEFRQENNLFYLTHLKQQGATLVLLPGNPGLREVLFLPRRNPAAETWTGHMYSAEEARRISGVSEIWEAKEFQPFMQSVRTRRAYRPQAEGVLLSASEAAGAAQPVTPPVPKSDQTPAAANAATPANPVNSNSPARLVTQNATTPVAAPVAASAATATTSAQPAPANASNVPTGFESLYSAMQQNDAALYLLLPGGDDSREFRQEQEFAAQWARAATGLNVRTAWPIFAEMRMRKSLSEMRLLQHAVDISIEGHQRAQAVAPTAKWEYEVEAEIDYTFRRRNADNWGYPNIVGCGPNATTLHYEESQGRVGANELILIDSGAEYEHYTADVTRTFPANGRFSPAQSEIYNVVLAAQEASFRVIRPGIVLSDVHKASAEVIKDGLLRLGLITDRNSNQFRIWFMHGTSHWLGMNVHDVSIPGVKLAPDMVFTVEPGIYIRPDALDYLPDTPENRAFIAAVRPAFEKYKGIGVRIEDDVVVTGDGYRNLSAALARTIPEIEAFIARARKEVRAEARPLPGTTRGHLFAGSPAQYARRGHKHGEE